MFIGSARPEAFWMVLGSAQHAKLWKYQRARCTARKLASGAGKLTLRGQAAWKAQLYRRMPSQGLHRRVFKDPLSTHPSPEIPQWNGDRLAGPGSASLVSRNCWVAKALTEGQQLPSQIGKIGGNASSKFIGRLQRHAALASRANRPSVEYHPVEPVE